MCYKDTGSSDWEEGSGRSVIVLSPAQNAHTTGSDNQTFVALPQAIGSILEIFYIFVFHCSTPCSERDPVYTIGAPANHRLMPLLAPSQTSALQFTWRAAELFLVFTTLRR